MNIFRKALKRIKAAERVSADDLKGVASAALAEVNEMISGQSGPTD